MAYADDVNQRTHRVGYYVRFVGIPTRLSTHNPDNWPNWSPSETFHASIIKDSITGGDESLDREAGFVEQGALSFRVMDTDTVRSLLRIRGGTNDYLATAVDDNDNLTLASGGAWSGGLPATLYLDRETVTLTAHTGAGTHTTTRGAEASVATYHQAGTRISTVPVHWYTREATVYAVNLDTGTEAAIFTGTLSASPSFNDGAWDLQLVGVINDYLKRPLCTGWQEQESISATYTAAGNIQFEVSNALNFSGKDLAYVRIEADGRAGIYGGQAGDVTISTATNPHTVTVLGTSYKAGDLYPWEMDAASCTLREIGVVYGRAGHVALQAMLSDLGDGSVDSNYDILAGRQFSATSSVDFLTKRMGAAIPAARVDIDSFQQMPDGHQLQIWLDEEVELGSFLTDEVLRRSGGYVYSTAAGVLTFRLYEPAVPTGSLTVYDRGDFLESNVTTIDDETGHIARALLECNYHPVTRTYAKKVEIVFLDDGPVYGARGASASWRSKAVWVGSLPTDDLAQVVSDPMDVLDIETTFDRQRARQVKGGRRSAVLVPWQFHSTLTVGTRLKLSHTYMPDHEGGQGVTGRVYEVTGRSLDWGAGFVKLELDEVPAGWLLAPAAAVASWDSGTTTITLSTSGALGELADNAFPGLDFMDGGKIRVYDASANFTSSSTATITSTSSTTLKIGTLTPPLTPAAGDLVVLEDSANTGNTNDIGADVQDFAFGADSSYLVGTGTAYERTGPEWG